MNDVMNFALNHMTVPNLGYVEFLDLAAKLGCVGVEVRNDLERPLFDGIDATIAGQIARKKGLRLLGVSQVYPFNTWNSARKEAVASLIATAKAAGAETISLIPRNDGTGLAEDARHSDLRQAMSAILPMLREADLTALIEPLGFTRSSLRSKTDLIETINALAIPALDGADRFKIVHDTFHHSLARSLPNGGAIFPEMTGIVHISGVDDPNLRFDEMEDEHRVLVDGMDCLGNVDQIRALLGAGYNGPISYECFSPDTHAMADPFTGIKRSFDFMTRQLQPQAA